MKRMMIILAGILLYTGCGRDNILWIEPGYEYTITNILVKNPQGNFEDILPIIFPFAEKVTFTKFHPLGLKGDGVVKVTNAEYHTTEYEAEGAFYDYDCDCYYYDWYTYEVNWTDTYENEYSFSWDKESQEKISLKFSKYDAIIQGTNSFWNLLDHDYKVTKDSRRQGKLVANVIVLHSDQAEIVLKR